MSEPRTAGVRREDRLAAGLDTASIVRRTRQETDSTHRVYALAWLVDSRHASREAAEQHFERRYGGRIHPQHVRYVVDDEGEERGAPPTVLLVIRRWNVVAEWKNRLHADNWAELYREEHCADRQIIPPDSSSVSQAVEGWLAEDEVRVVVRNSREEHMLIAYGRLKLPA